VRELLEFKNKRTEGLKVLSRPSIMIPYLVKTARLSKLKTYWRDFKKES
jgi:hypothetical protein